MQSETDGHALHVAVVMDGNGRWATRRGRPRAAGHAAGAVAVRRAVRAAAVRGIGTLTLYAFSGDNWRRPAAEVGVLMALFRRYLDVEAARCASDGVRLTVIGRRDRLDPSLRAAIERAEAATRAGRTIHVRIAIDYSGRDAIVAAAALAASERLALATESGEVDRAIFAACVGRVCHMGEPTADVDLLIRTGGELRASDFLLWECAYAELYFVRTPWPDFGASDLDAALREFRRRDRRFGALPALAG
jgi:undecaprenyl diphosphate synthase